MGRGNGITRSNDATEQNTVSLRFFVALFGPFSPSSPLLHFLVFSVFSVFSVTLLSQSPPNVLLITLDTVRADRIGAYGYAKASTPALDRLAREGVRFTDATTPVAADRHRPTRRC